MTEENLDLSSQNDSPEIMQDISQENTKIKSEPIHAISHDEEPLDNEAAQEEEYLNIDEFDEDLEEKEDEEDNEKAQQQNTKGKKSIPEWAKKNPAGWAAKVAKGVRKEVSREHEEKYRTLEEKYKQLENIVTQNIVKKEEPEIETDPIQDNSNLDEYSFYDPSGSGLVLNAQTVEGQQALANYELERKRKEHQELIQTEQLKKQAVKISHERNNRIEDLKNTILNDAKDNPEIVKTIVNSLANSKNSPDGIVDFCSVMQSNKTDFLYYLAGNQKEWDRLTALHPASLAGELLRHHVEYHNRRSGSNAPPPVSSEGTSVGKSGHSADDIISKVKRRYEQHL